MTSAWSASATARGCVSLPSARGAIAVAAFVFGDLFVTEDAPRAPEDARPGVHAAALRAVRRMDWPVYNFIDGCGAVCPGAITVFC